VEPSLQTAPKPGFECRGITRVANQPTNTCPQPPKLFRAYLDLSARLCGPPAIDREFRTIDFLTLLDLQSIPSRLRTRFFQP
jgi:putative hemolysin